MFRLLIVLFGRDAEQTLLILSVVISDQIELIQIVNIQPVILVGLSLYQIIYLLYSFILSIKNFSWILIYLVLFQVLQILLFLLQHIDQISFIALQLLNLDRLLHILFIDLIKHILLDLYHFEMFVFTTLIQRKLFIGSI